MRKSRTAFTARLRPNYMVDVAMNDLESALGEILGASLHVEAKVGVNIYSTPYDAMERLQILENVAGMALDPSTKGKKRMDRLIKGARSLVTKRTEFVERFGKMGGGLLGARTRASAMEEAMEIVTEMKSLKADARKIKAEMYNEWPAYTDGKQY